MLFSRGRSVVLALVFLLSPAAHADLYDDDKTVAAGDLKDLDYWQCKYYQTMLEAGIKSKQPEYLVGTLASVLSTQTLPPLIKKYPKHEELKKWLEKDESILKRVNKNADRNVHWKPEFEYWDNTHYRQAWVNMNMGRMEEEAKDWPNAVMRYSFANENANTLAEHEDWMKAWPADVIKFVKETKEASEAKAKEMKKKV